MILGVLLGKRNYPLQKYFFVLLIVTGIVLFMLKDKVSKETSDNSFGLGELLIILSLIMDGLTGAVQVSDILSMVLLYNTIHTILYILIFHCL